MAELGHFKAEREKNDNAIAQNSLSLVTLYGLYVVFWDRFACVCAVCISDE